MIQKPHRSMDEAVIFEGAVPISTRFDDPYFSRIDGRAETDHVFIAGNDLPARWPAMSTCLIAELGFGTGLNFLETLRQFKTLSSPGARLQFLSFELYPMDRGVMLRALSPWPEIGDLAEALLRRYDPDQEMQHLEFGEVAELFLFLGDAQIRLPKLEFSADAWYLDGFAPARNPELWSRELIQQIGDRTAPGGTFATYSSAGWVRRNLEAAGFRVDRLTGFAGKRHMLAGYRPR